MMKKRQGTVFLLNSMHSIGFHFEPCNFFGESVERHTLKSSPKRAASQSDIEDVLSPILFLRVALLKGVGQEVHSSGEKLGPVPALRDNSLFQSKAAEDEEILDNLIRRRLVIEGATTNISSPGVVIVQSHSVAIYKPLTLLLGVKTNRPSRRVNPWVGAFTETFRLRIVSPLANQLAGGPISPLVLLATVVHRAALGAEPTFDNLQIAAGKFTDRTGRRCGTCTFGRSWQLYVLGNFHTACFGPCTLGWGL